MYLLIQEEVTSKLYDHHMKVSEDLSHISGQVKYFSDTLVAMQEYQEQGFQYLFQQLTELKAHQLSKFEGQYFVNDICS